MLLVLLILFSILIVIFVDIVFDWGQIKARLTLLEATVVDTVVFVIISVYVVVIYVLIVGIVIVAN